MPHDASHRDQAGAAGACLVDARVARGPWGGSDEDLARRSASGDDRAFDDLVGRYRERLCRFARWYTAGTSEEAEDVAQDILVEVYRSLASFRGRSKFGTWLFGVARNVCRRACRRARARERWPLARSPDEEEALADIPDTSIDPALSLERGELRATVWAAIETLSPEQRAVLVLREMEGLSYDEIAEVAGIPVGTVRSRLHNGRAAMARRLAALGMRATERQS